MDHGVEPAWREDDRATALATFSEVAADLLSGGTVDEVFAHVVALAVATIEGCDCAGIFFAESGVVTTPAFSDPVVVAIDAMQHEHGEGPCLAAMRHKASYYAEDLGDDARWPSFGAAAAAGGMRSLLALPLPTGRSTGALNLYAAYPSAFGVIDRARAQLLATLATGAVSLAETHEDADRKASDFQSGLATREMIGQAQGILMERERITADQAFDVLRRASQHLNIKLREVAQTLIETGERPDTGPDRAVSTD